MKLHTITTQLEKEHHIVLNDLSSKSVILRHSIEAAHILIEDMQTLQKLLQETGTNIFFGFNKLQSHGSSLTDLLHICRNCLNEMGREFLASHTQSQHLQQKL
ncbi:hypothetical protein C0J52_07691 [Blattella germanica]|nr:hypothetical protein C0J52_07691 [Blattella germanica]